MRVMEENDIVNSFLLQFPTMKIKENNNLVVKVIKESSDRLVVFVMINPSDNNAQDSLDVVMSLDLKGCARDRV